MHIDLNADLGEGAPHDRELLKIVSSVNISCGEHAGDADTIANAIHLAKAHGVRIGAHPSYPDRENFGRKAMLMHPHSLRNHILYQLHALRGMLYTQGAQLTHIKPHGALYNQAAVDGKLAEELALILQEFDAQLAIVGLAGGEFLRCVKQLGMKTVSEGFADRRYAANGTLVPRSNPLGIIHDPAQAVAQCLEMIGEGKITTLDGKRIDMRVDTVCLHGDTAEALIFARSLVSALDKAGIAINRANPLIDKAPSL